MKRYATLFWAFAAASIPGVARAHFTLTYPPSWIVENGLGDPQKDEPCGGEGGTPSGIVTRFRPGETITVQWTETIYHPGHWRIAFTENRADFVEPMVTVDNNDFSVSFTVTDPPVLPVLLDNLYPRTGNNGSPMTFSQDITFPNVECAHCTLQVLQMMVGHGPPNYIYHHCADIELVADPIDAGVIPEDAGIEEDSGSIIAPDASPNPPDGGDAAVIAEDAAVIAEDAAVIAEDAAVIAPGADAGNGGRVAGLKNTRVTGSCACSAAAADADQGAGSRSAALAALFFALTGLRARSRGRCSSRPGDRKGRGLPRSGD